MLGRKKNNELVKKKDQILVTGSSSRIFINLKKILLKKAAFTEFSSKNLDMSDLDIVKKNLDFFLKFNIIIFFQGLLIGKKQYLKSSEEIYNQITVNLLSIIEICEYVLERNKNVRIIILGSESGVKGSFDKTYFLSKSAIHNYVKEKKIFYKKQQLICIAPSTIEDTNMTENRKDYKKVLKSSILNPKKRLINSLELAKLIKSILYDLTDYINNTVIHVNGGKFSRMQ